MQVRQIVDVVGVVKAGAVAVGRFCRFRTNIDRFQMLDPQLAAQFVAECTAASPQLQRAQAVPIDTFCVPDFVDYSGPLAESVLLANTAYRAGGGFDWDAVAFKASGNANVDEYLKPQFRKGWQVDELS